MKKLLYSLSLITIIGCTYTPKKLVKNNLIIIENNRPSNLFPATIETSEQSHIITQIHDGLFVFDPTTEDIHPRIAKQWFINSASNRFTILLHDSIFFHNDSCFEQYEGRQLNAYDVKKSIEYSLWQKYYKKNNTGLLSQIKGAENFINKCDSTAYQWEYELEGIKVIDSLQLEIHLNQSTPTFLYELIGPDMVILPREGIKKYANLCMVGCGAFMISYFGKNNDSIVIVKNPKYYRKDPLGKQLPFLDCITFIFEARQSISLRKIRDEEAHVLLNVDRRLLPDFLDQNIDLFKEQNPRLVLEQSKGMEQTEIFSVKNIDVKNLIYNKMNLLYLDRVFLSKEKKETHQ